MEHAAEQVASPAVVAAGDAWRAKRRAEIRIDAILRRESCGHFRNLNQLVTTPGYTPTLRRDDLANAYDAAQEARGDSRRACR